MPTEEPEAERQINLTDADSALMRKSKRQVSRHAMRIATPGATNPKRSRNQVEYPSRAFARISAAPSMSLARSTPSASVPGQAWRRRVREDEEGAAQTPRSRSARTRRGTLPVAGPLREADLQADGNLPSYALRLRRGILQAAMTLSTSPRLQGDGDDRRRGQETTARSWSTESACGCSGAGRLTVAAGLARRYAVRNIRSRKRTPRRALADESGWLQPAVRRRA